jgi:hypothetical protein
VTSFKEACMHFANKTKPGTFAHLMVTHGGRMMADFDKTVSQNDEARFFCKNVVPMAGGGNIAIHISVSSDGEVEVFYGGKDGNHRKRPEEVES